MGIYMTLLLGQGLVNVAFLSILGDFEVHQNSRICWRWNLWNIPNIWVMWNIGTSIPSPVLDVISGRTLNTSLNYSAKRFMVCGVQWRVYITPWKDESTSGVVTCKHPGHIYIYITITYYNHYKRHMIVGWYHCIGTIGIFSSPKPSCGDESPTAEIPIWGTSEKDPQLLLQRSSCFNW